MEKHEDVPLEDDDDDKNDESYESENESEEEIPAIKEKGQEKSKEESKNENHQSDQDRELINGKIDALREFINDLKQDYGEIIILKNQTAMSAA